VTIRGAADFCYSQGKIRMSTAFRTLSISAGLIVLAGTASAVRPVAETTLANPLQVSMIADNSAHQAFTGMVQFRITNNSSQSLKVPSWQLPSDDPGSSQFAVYANGHRVQYLGKMIHRTAPTEADFVTFKAYETKVIRVNLGNTYDLSAGGDYSVRFQSFLQDAKTDNGRRIAGANGRMAKLESVPLKLWVDGKNSASQLKGSGPSTQGKTTGGTVVNGVTFIGCSATQITDGGNAVVQSRLYTENAKTYLNGGTVGPRYTTWFGAYTSSRYATGTAHFVSIDTAMDQSGGQVAIDCTCKQSYYAFVYPDKPYQIHVCRAFWTAPMTGTDSKAGTLIHEMSHFNVTAGTNDWVYGQTAAKNLAISNPDEALDNADNHEYVGENNPFQN
jgi:peptidyl-Lys metalloendopeptidase